MRPDIANYCIEKHRETNHYYDKYLPYEFHLRMVVQVANQFAHILNNDPKIDSLTGKWEYDRGVDNTITLREACIAACWGHDLIEDCRVSYNDCVSNISQNAAEIIYAVTNEKGKTRKERANEKYYEGIRNTNGALFVKLCDRIANVQYSKISGSRMFEQYVKEMPFFKEMLYAKVSIYRPMWEYLETLLTTV